MAGKASKEAIDFDYSVESKNLSTFVVALLTNTSIWALADAIVKFFAHCHKLSVIVNFATHSYIISYSIEILLLHVEVVLSI